MTTKKPVFKVAISALLFVFLFTTIVTAYEASPFKKIEQAKSNWCWAACSEMVGYCAYPSTDRSQWTAVHYFKGTSSDSYPNSPGTIADVKNAVEYIDHGRTGFSTYSRLCSSDVFSCIKNKNNGIVAFLFKSDVKIGHAIAIYGVYTQNGTDMVKIADPWFGQSTYSISYSDFSNGTGAMASIGYGNYKWTESCYPS